MNKPASLASAQNQLCAVALGVEYNGLRYCGWQTQPDQPTVQDALELALKKFVTKPVATICAGRTDTGVHGTGQVVSIAVDCVRSESSWVRGVNTHLPPTVAVLWARAVPDEFHARFDATARTYEYWLYNHAVRSPVYAKRAGWVWRPLDVDRMREGAECLLGTHDFSSFRAAECQAKTPVRTIESLDIVRKGRLVGLRIAANAFLHHMVRNIVGTLVYVGTGRERPEWVRKVLEARSRTVAAPTFSPDGLYLTGVRYPGVDIPQSGMSPFGFDD